jgi:nucleotide-binding universal stress UspA family protein
VKHEDSDGIRIRDNEEKAGTTQKENSGLFAVSFAARSLWRFRHCLFDCTLVSSLGNGFRISKQKLEVKEVKNMYQNILVPLDGSELAEYSLIHALAIESNTKPLRIVLLTVLQPAIPEDSYSWGGLVAKDLANEIANRQKNEAKNYLDKVILRFKKEGYELKPVIGYGDAADEIIKFVDSNNTNLIVMTTHSRSGLTRWVLGSVADKVIRSSKVPVMLVPPE